MSMMKLLHILYDISFPTKPVASRCCLFSLIFPLRTSLFFFFWWTFTQYALQYAQKCYTYQPIHQICTGKGTIDLPNRSKSQLMFMGLFT